MGGCLKKLRRVEEKKRWLSLVSVSVGEMFKVPVGAVYGTDKDNNARTNIPDVRESIGEFARLEVVKDVLKGCELKRRDLLGDHAIGGTVHGFLFPPEFKMWLDTRFEFAETYDAASQSHRETRCDKVRIGLRQMRALVPEKLNVGRTSVAWRPQVSSQALLDADGVVENFHGPLRAGLRAQPPGGGGRTMNAPLQNWRV